MNSAPIAETKSPVLKKDHYCISLKKGFQIENRHNLFFILLAAKALIIILAHFLDFSIRPRY